MGEFWDRIDVLKDGFKKDMETIGDEIVRSIGGSAPSYLYDASKHLIKTKGKRIRPALLALSFRAVNRTKEIEYAAPIAIAVELIHTATMIHDDIIDKSAMRRGVQSVNKIWGDDTALLAGDLIFSKAFGLVGAHEKKEISDIISGVCMKLAEGEMLESMHTKDLNMTEEVYLEIVERKTAMLFEASTKCGAILGDGTAKEVKALSRYGYFLGIGFQMIDDLLDITAGEAKLGKPVGTDITLGKPTFFILHALKNAEEKEREELKKIVLNGNGRREIKKALEIIRKSESIDYASERARTFIEKAKGELRYLKNSDAKKALELIADSAIERQF